MASQKNQHFVPKCYFKPFSVGREGKAINIYNIKLKKVIENAPVKGQCSKNYFHGKDLSIENALVFLEGKYASAIRDISETKGISKERDSWIRTFMCFQHHRTEYAVIKHRLAQVEMTALVSDDILYEYDMTDEEIIKYSLQMASDTTEIVNDLKFFILNNDTPRSFVASDDPSILSNRFYIQRLKNESFGMASSGIFLLMPISPKLAAVMYDGNVYTIPGKQGGKVTISTVRDIESVNVHQILSARENIYFSDLSEAIHIRSDVDKYEFRRPAKWHNLTQLVQLNEIGGDKIFGSGSDEEVKSAQETLINLSSRYPNPKLWPSFLRFRDPVRTYSDGSAAGYVRRAEWLRTPP